jgi:putative transposase
VGCKRVKYSVIKELSAKYPVTLLCQLLHVSRSGYYDWKNRQSVRARDAMLIELIEKCQTKVKYTYGYRRMKTWLSKNAGLKVNHKSLLRIMREHKLSSRIRRKRKVSYSRICNKFDNILARNFNANEPNQKWATDITLIPTKDGWLYLSVLQDLFDSSIQGYKCYNHHKTKIVTDTIMMALNGKDSKSKTIIHSDQGTQYTSGEYAYCCINNNLVPSMSHRGTPLDNACIESFFSALKCEWLYNTNKMPALDVISDIKQYMHFYNYERITYKDGLTPYEIRNNYYERETEKHNICIMSVF